MQKKYTRIFTYRVTLACEKCVDGEMEGTGYCLTSNPPKYPHICNKCGHTHNVSNESFPKIEYTDHELNNTENESF